MGEVFHKRSFFLKLNYCVNISIVHCLPAVTNLFLRMWAPLIGFSISIRVSSLTTPGRTKENVTGDGYITAYMDVYRLCIHVGM